MNPQLVIKLLNKILSAVGLQPLPKIVQTPDQIETAIEIMVPHLSSQQSQTDPVAMRLHGSTRKQPKGESADWAALRKAGLTPEQVLRQAMRLETPR